MIPAPHDLTLRVAILTALVCSAATMVYGLAELEPDPIVSTLLTFAPAITVILWLQKDAHRTGVADVQDLGLFLWFAWPVVIPWYAFKSRGRAGWRLLLGLLAMICSVWLTQLVLYWLSGAAQTP
jgi:hypothetical protein